jgi:hypothetical protein
MPVTILFICGHKQHSNDLSSSVRLQSDREASKTSIDPDNMYTWPEALDCVHSASTRMHYLRHFDSRT